MSFQLGIVNWLILIIGLFCFFRLSRLGKLALVCSLLAIILVINWSVSSWIWQSLGFIQFPWRLLSVPMLFVPIIAALLIRSKLLAILILVLAIYANRNHIRINQSQYINTSPSYFLRSDITTTSTPDELSPLVYDSNTKHLFTSSWPIVLGQGISLLGLGVLIWSKIKPCYQ